jgi:hypothetical protein
VFDWLVAIVARALTGPLAQLERKIMASLEDLNAKVDGLSAGLDEVQTGVDVVQQTVVDLRAQLESGTPVTQADLDALDAKLAVVAEKLGTVKTDVTTPV